MNNIIILIILVLILIVIYIIWLYQRDIENQFGTYTTIIGNCTYDSSTNKSTQNILKICVPNPITNKGCLNDSFEQTYDSILSTEDCTLTPFSSIWQQTNSSICTPPNNPDNPNINPAPNGQCIPAINNNNNKLLGRKTVTFQCVSNNNQGPNNCTNIALQNITNPTGINGILPLIKTYNIGDTVDVVEECDTTQTNPICGGWNSCSFVNNYILSSNCVIPTGNNPALLLKEGFLYNSAVCTLNNGNMLTFNSNDPTTHQCLQNPVNNNCNIDNFTTTNIPNSVINNSFICSKDYNNSNISNNPVCLQICRLYPTNNTTLGTNLDILINNPFICLNNNNYLSAYQLPRTDNNSQNLLYNMYEPNNNFPSNTLLYNTNLLAISLGFTYNGNKSNCSDEQLLLSTAILCTLGGIIKINDNKIQAKIMMNIPINFTGWLTDNTLTPNWTQIKTQYNSSIGTDFNNANDYIITVVEPFDNIPLENYKNSIGTMVISIKTINNQSLNNIKDVNNNDVDFFNNIKIIIFDYKTFNYDIRGNINSTNSCNLYITTN